MAESSDVSNVWIAGYSINVPACTALWLYLTALYCGGLTKLYSACDLWWRSRTRINLLDIVCQRHHQSSPVVRVTHIFQWCKYEQRMILQSKLVHTISPKIIIPLVFSPSGLRCMNHITNITLVTFVLPRPSS